MENAVSSDYFLHCEYVEANGVLGDGGKFCAVEWFTKLVYPAAIIAALGSAAASSDISSAEAAWKRHRVEVVSRLANQDRLKITTTLVTAIEYGAPRMCANRMRTCWATMVNARYLRCQRTPSFVFSSTIPCASS